MSVFTTRALRLVSLLALVCAFSACDEDAEGFEAPDIVGSYTDDFGMALVISDTRLVLGSAPDTSGFDISFVDNGAGVLIAHNDADNQFSPDLWSRFEWATDSTGQLRLCQSVFDGADESSTRNAAGADASDFDTGCGGFGWSILTTAAQ